MINIKNIKIILIIICLLLLNTFCFADSELADKTRKAKKSDLIGTWVMVYQTVSPLFMNDSLFFADFQILRFSGDDHVKNIASKKRLKRGEVDFLLERMPKNTVYGFIEAGLLVVERSKEDFDNLVVSITEKDFTKPLRFRAPLLKKGDLIVSYLDGKKNLYMQRYFRRYDLGSN